MFFSSVVALSYAKSRNRSFEGQLGNAISQNYRSNNNEQQAVGAGLAGFGIIFFVVGIVLVATKSGSQRKKEIELALLKQMQNKSTPPPFNSVPPPLKQVPPPLPDVPVTNPKNSMEEKFSNLEKLMKLKELGVLNEEEFQEQKRKILD